MLLPDWFPETHISTAETVSEYLITLRGGAPFLSGADCRLLVQWLDDDIPAPAILSALERVALRRRAKRVRSRLSLNATKGELRKLLGKKEEPQKKRSSSHVFSILHQRIINSIQENTEYLELQRSIAHQLIAIDPKQDEKIITEEAISLIASFHQQAWENTNDRIELLEQAESEIEMMKSMIPPQRWNELVEEIARDHLRSRFPLFSAQMIWDSVKGRLL